MIYDTIPDLTEHVFRSVRGWIHRLFPDLQIHLSRKTTTDDARPAFRMEMIGGPEYETTDAASGMRWLRCSVHVVYQGTEVFDAQRVAGTLAANAVPPARIPLRLYNFAYPAGMTVTADDTPATLPALLDLAVAWEGPAGRTAPSTRVTVAPGATALAVDIPHWPAGRRADTFHLYAGLPGQSLHLQQSLSGDVAIAQTILAGFDDAGTTPPNQADLLLGGMRCESINTRVPEMNETDGHHDALATMRLCIEVPLAASAQVADVLLP